MKNGRIKSLLLWLMCHPYAARPRWWVRTFVNPWTIRRGRGSIIRSSARLDIFPWNSLRLGRQAIIESRTTINNGMGDIAIGDRSRIGIGSTIIAPVNIGSDVHLAQNIVLSGLNHNYADPMTTIGSQGVSIARITISDDVWIGANAVITAGVTIGRHCVVAAGSVVTHSVPDNSIVAGVPAKVIKTIS